MNAAARQYELNHRAERHEQRRLRKMDPWQRARFLLRSATERAAALGMEINLTREWIAARLKTGVCEATGLHLDLAGEAQTDSRCRWPWAPSLDRIDNSKGYVQGNVRVVVWMYNLAKNRWTDADVLRLAEALVSRQQDVSRQPV